MFRLIRFVIASIFWFLFLWLAVTVPIGKYTLYQHVVRLIHTKEAQELKEGLEKTAEDSGQKLQKEWTSPQKPSK